MSLTLTVTVSTADQPRLQAALAAAGIANGAAVISARLAQIVQDYEVAQQTQAALAPVATFVQGYQPITPTTTITPGP